MRPILRQVHLWMGLTLGGLFALLGVTGSALVFYPEIDGLLHPEVRAEASAAPDWDRALATVRNAFPDKAGPWRFEVTGTGGAGKSSLFNALLRLVEPRGAGGLAFAFVGGMGAALTLGSRRGGVLIAVIVLPLFAPPVIFGGGNGSAGRT